MKTNYSNGKFRWFCQSKRAALPIQSPSVKGVAPKLLKKFINNRHFVYELRCESVILIVVYCWSFVSVFSSYPSEHDIEGVQDLYADDGGGGMLNRSDLG